MSNHSLTCSASRRRAGGWRVRMEIHRLDFEFKSLFRMAYRARTHGQTVQLTLSDGEFIGRGEALGVSYRGETADTLIEQLAKIAGAVRNAISRVEVQNILPAG